MHKLVSPRLLTCLLVMAMGLASHGSAFAQQAEPQQVMGSSYMLAAAKKKKTKAKKTKKKKTKKTATARTSSNAENVVIGAAVNTGHIYYGLGLGVEGWTPIMNGQLQVGGQYLTTFTKILEGSNNDGSIKLRAEMEQSAIAVRARYFVWNSMYISGALARSSFAGPYELELDSPLGSLYYYSKITGSAMMITLGVGNQWNFGSLVLGVDWFALSIPMGIQVSANATGLVNAGGEPPTEFDPAQYSDQLNAEVLKHVKSAMRYHILLLHVGITL